MLAVYLYGCAPRHWLEAARYGFFTASERPKRMPAPAVREETMVHLRHKVNGSAELTDSTWVRARSAVGRCGVSPLLSMVRD